MYIYISLPDGGQFELPSICLSPPPALLKVYLKHLAGRTTHEEGVESVKFLNFKLYIASALPTFVSPWAISVPQSKKRRYYSSNWAVASSSIPTCGTLVAHRQKSCSH